MQHSNKISYVAKQNNKLNRALYYRRVWYLFCFAAFFAIFWSLVAAAIVFNKTTTSQTTSAVAAPSTSATGTTASTSTSTSTSTTSTSTLTTSTSTSTATTILSYVWNSTGNTVVSDSCCSANALAIDSSNALYVVQSAKNRVQKYIIGATNNSTTVAGNGSGVAGSSSSLLNSPSDVAVDSNGNVYVLDQANNRVQLWYNGASYGVTVAGTNSSGTAANQLNCPYFMARDPTTGTLYISDSGNGRVMQYLYNASSGTVVAGGYGIANGPTQLDYNSGVYFDSSSNSLVIATYLGNNIVRWKLGYSNWTLITGNVNGTSGSSSTMLYNPMGLTLDPSGNIYVADRNNHRIQLFSNTSNGTTIAGITGSPGSSATQLNSPSAVALDSQLNLYVADTGNNRIQMFSRS
ncbi:unnamed protein product [Rotaria socialis]|uniref:NHL repeat containing protein n=1 Tax=Rotaria socialis TaxID=392032 RepID=A0A817W0L9_9BILA|nr:unnamed protein product [Rotaria socialis]